MVKEEKEVGEWRWTGGVGAEFQVHSRCLSEAFEMHSDGSLHPYLLFYIAQKFFSKSVNFHLTVIQ